MSAPAAERFLTLDEAAVRARCSREHVRRACSAGKVRAGKSTGVWLIDWFYKFIPFEATTGCLYFVLP